MRAVEARPVKGDMVKRRQESRLPGGGEVRLLLDGPDALEIRGQLVDRSRHGFRARHAHSSLAAGTEVRFWYSGAEGRARVVWNCVLNGAVQSGFFVLG